MQLRQGRQEREARARRGRAEEDLRAVWRQLSAGADEAIPEARTSPLAPSATRRPLFFSTLPPRTVSARPHLPRPCHARVSRPQEVKRELEEDDTTEEGLVRLQALLVRLTPPPPPALSSLLCAGTPCGGSVRVERRRRRASV